MLSNILKLLSGCDDAFEHDIDVRLKEPMCHNVPKTYNDVEKRIVSPDRYDNYSIQYDELWLCI